MSDGSGGCRWGVVHPVYLFLHFLSERERGMRTESTIRVVESVAGLPSENADNSIRTSDFQTIGYAALRKRPYGKLLFILEAEKAFRKYLPFCGVCRRLETQAMQGKQQL